MYKLLSSLLALAKPRGQDVQQTDTCGITNTWWNAGMGNSDTIVSVVNCSILTI